MQAPADNLTIPEIRAFLAVRSRLTVRTAAEEARLTPAQVHDALARVNRSRAISPRGRTRR